MNGNLFCNNVSLLRYFYPTPAANGWDSFFSLTGFAGGNCFMIESSFNSFSFRQLVPKCDH